MQLHALRSHPVIKALGYTGFILIIISFIFFYGWDPTGRAADLENPVLATYRSEDLLSFLPWRRWRQVRRAEVLSAREAVVNRKLSMLDPQWTSLLAQQGRGLDWLATDQEAIQEAVDRHLLRERAAAMGIVVSREEAERSLREQRGLTPQRLQDELNRRGMTLDQYLAAIQDNLTADRLMRLLQQDARTSLYELWLEYLLVKEKFTLRVTAFAVADFEAEIEPDEARLQAYLEAHHERYRVPAKRRYAYAKLTREEVREAIAPDDDQLRAFFEQNASRFRQAEAVQLEDVFAPVSADQPTTAAERLLDLFFTEAMGNPQPWGIVVSQLRQREASARLFHRPDWWLDRDDSARTVHGPEFLDRAFALVDDQISTPVLSPQGLHLIHRLGYREARLPPLEEIRAEVEQAYKDEKVEERYRAEVERLREAAGRFSAVRDWAQAVGLEDGLTTLVLTSATLIPEVGQLARHASYIRRLKPRRMSELIPLEDAVSVLEVVQETDSYLPELEEVREPVRAAVVRESAEARASEAAERAFARLQTGEPFDIVSEDAPTTPAVTQPFTRLDRVDVLGAPFIGFDRQTTRITEGSTGMSPYGFGEEAIIGHAIWQVEKIEAPTVEDFRDERRSFERQYLALKQFTIVEEWLADLRRSAQFRLMGPGPTAPAESTPESSPPAEDGRRPPK